MLKQLRLLSSISADTIISVKDYQRYLGQRELSSNSIVKKMQFYPNSTYKGQGMKSTVLKTWKLNGPETQKDKQSFPSPEFCPIRAAMETKS